MDLIGGLMDFVYTLTHIVYTVHIVTGAALSLLGAAIYCNDTGNVGTSFP